MVAICVAHPLVYFFLQIRDSREGQDSLSELGDGHYDLGSRRLHPSIGRRGESESASGTLKIVVETKGSPHPFPKLTPQIQSLSHQPLVNQILHPTLHPVEGGLYELRFFVHVWSWGMGSVPYSQSS